MADFDFIIVGAGSAGCVLAERLTADPATRVLLLEAGGEDRHPFIHMPKGMAKLNTDPNHVWSWETEPDGDLPAEIWRRGKVLGGSSAVNGMMYFRGQPEDYDGWAEQGADGWNWSEMERAFRSIEDHELGEGGGRGVGGAVGISQNGSRVEINRRYIEAGREMGIPVVQDPNAQREGVGYATWTIRGGRRSSTGQTFLKIARKRPNLHVETGVLVDRVLFDGRRAAGVVARRHGQPVEYRTEGEVLLCAGGLVSPLILQRSGIGDPALLASLGIPVTQARPAVGNHMLEHRLLMMEYALTRPLSDNPQFRGLRLGINALRYALTRSGPIARGSYEVASFVRTRPEIDRPDAEILMAPFSWGMYRGKVAVGRSHAIHMFGYPLRSRSEGSIAIRSTDPAAPPIIRPNYLADPYDREVTIDMFRMIRRWMTQPAIAPLIAGETKPGPQIESDDDIIAEFKRRGSAGMHACGTARMGSDADAVLDPQLRVNGVANLRVIDGSIMPTMVSANTNGPIMAIGWRASEIIRDRRRNTIAA